MSAATEQTAARYTDTLAAALRLFDGCKGTVVVTGRTLHGFGQQDAHLTPPFDQVPLPVLLLLRDGYSLRLSPATRSGQALAELPVLTALWRPATRFDLSTGYRHAVEPDEVARISAVLSTMPLPSLLIDGAHEVVAAWRLAEPFDLRKDAARAQVAQIQLAERLGGDVAMAEDLTATLPLAGIIRNWNATVPDFIEIVTAEPARRYRVEQLLEPEGGEAP